MKIRRVAVIGAGTMGQGIAQVVACAGYSVVLIDSAENKAHQARANIYARLASRVDKGKLSKQEFSLIKERICCQQDIANMLSIDLVIEAVIEDLTVKQDIFRRLNACCRDDCIFATNTSSISVTALASVLERPDFCIGLHFFNPAPVMKLVEVVKGFATNETVIQVCCEWLFTCQKTFVIAENTPGFIVNRIARPFYAQALLALESKQLRVSTLDEYIKAAGRFLMGPGELMDLIGHDVNYAVTQSVFEGFYRDARYKPSLLQRTLIEAQHLGKKSQQGFYQYIDAKKLPLETEFRANGSSMLHRSSDQHIQIDIYGDCSIFPQFLSLFPSAKQHAECLPPLQIPCVVISGVCLIPAWMSATQACQVFGMPVVTFDLCMDYQVCPYLLLGQARQNQATQIKHVIDYFHAQGKSIAVIDDYPGLILWRTWALIINEAVDMCAQQHASMNDIDIAMKQGVNYPYGPFEMLSIYPESIWTLILNQLFDFYKEFRYRASPELVLRSLTHEGKCKRVKANG